MAYSMFERPKLQNAKSLKFYPEEYDHHVSFRHKTLPPDFDLTIEKPKMVDNDSLRGQTSYSSNKCPIYVHTFRQNEGDYVPKPQKHTPKKHRSAIEKLEETYWANWKPEKNGPKKSKLPEITSRSPEIQIIKSAPERRRKIKVHSKSREQIESDFKIKKNASVSQEIQTDLLPPPIKEDKEVEVATIKEEIIKEETIKEEQTKTSGHELEETVTGPTQEEKIDEKVDSKFLKHKDSLILNIKKQKEEKEHFDQPKCIRLYQKPGKTSKSFIKGGSYPLKSCLKKESTITKAKLARPGSPMIVPSNYSNKHGKTRR